MKAFVCAVLLALLVAVVVAQEKPKEGLKGSEAVYVASPYAATYGYYGAYPYAYAAPAVVSAYSAFPYSYYYR